MANVEVAAPRAAAADGDHILQVEHATHRFGEVVALDDVSITARRGEFLTLLGESGSGKTTLLRIVAGLERPTRIARIAIDGEDVSAIPASRRNCTTVFQHYALFPHMSVGQNVEYGLRVRGIDKDDRRKRAEDALALVRLLDKYGRRVHQLSGGERQRVALARALVTEPAILLLDEPLGALDEKLRVDMQVELLDLHEKLGLTFIYVTHSQEEALTMSDRIILMRRGRIVQEGPPTDLFDRPATRFVADFMGVENLLEGDHRERAERHRQRAHRRAPDQRRLERPRPGGDGRAGLCRGAGGADQAGAPPVPVSTSPASTRCRAPAGRRSTRASTSTRPSIPTSARSRRGSGTAASMSPIWRRCGGGNPSVPSPRTRTAPAQAPRSTPTDHVSAAAKRLDLDQPARIGEAGDDQERRRRLVTPVRWRSLISR